MRTENSFSFLQLCHCISGILHQVGPVELLKTPRFDTKWGQKKKKIKLELGRVGWEMQTKSGSVSPTINEILLPPAGMSLIILSLLQELPQGFWAPEIWFLWNYWRSRNLKLSRESSRFHLIRRGKTEIKKILKKSALPILRAPLTLEEVISVMA